ncbi:MAG: DUF5696 domain-containing protein, partial [Clostridiales bacterium]|nr:DUF5696 domain-containing protein [Clostridiales bacterium]
DVAAKEPLMPVFGAAHGDRQAAFAAWATDGAEHMEIIVAPHNNMTWYNLVYPRFVYNRAMHQVYNRKGEGYFRLYPERLSFDLSMTYRFLAGDGAGDGFPADYVGMALAYREHLLETGGIAAKEYDGGPMPIRIDFIMSDVKKSVVGTTNVVTTTASEAAAIARDLRDSGVIGISGGMLGFQDGGIMAAKPWETRFTGSIGSRRDYQNLFEELGGLGIDMSFSQNYSLINKLQMGMTANQAYHINNWGVRAYISYEAFVPVTEVSYAKPTKSAEWLARQAKSAANLGAKSVTVTGMTRMLISHYGDGPTTAEEAAELYEKTFADIKDTGLKINAETPNAFLWKHTDRFLQAPMLTTQYILETDAVPFLQLVLNGTMEIYAPHANFSFYTQADILRMIDYNTYPSFVLTQSPAYLLTATNSLMYYSTEYTIYKDIIINVYNQINAALSRVAGKAWTDREVYAEGVILNTYDDGTRIVINYTDAEITVLGRAVAALSAEVIDE